MRSYSTICSSLVCFLCKGAFFMLVCWGHNNTLKRFKFPTFPNKHRVMCRPTWNLCNRTVLLFIYFYISIFATMMVWKHTAFYFLQDSTHFTLFKSIFADCPIKSVLKMWADSIWAYVLFCPPWAFVAFIASHMSALHDCRWYLAWTLCSRVQLYRYAVLVYVMLLYSYCLMFIFTASEEYFLLMLGPVYI